MVGDNLCDKEFIRIWIEENRFKDDNTFQCGFYRINFHKLLKSWIVMCQFSLALWMWPFFELKLNKSSELIFNYLMLLLYSFSNKIYIRPKKFDLNGISKLCQNIINDILRTFQRLFKCHGKQRTKKKNKANGKFIGMV